MYDTQQPITSWAAEDRPREKMLQRGIGALTDAEILAILLGTGSRELSAIGLARLLLDSFGGLEQLARCTVAELTKVKGIGHAKAISITSAFELGKRKAIATNDRFQIVGSKNAVAFLRPKMEDLTREVFYLLILNRKNEVKAERIVFSGGVSSTIVDIKFLLKEAIDHLASAIIVAHNHPSGNPRPSQADIDLTIKLNAACELIDVKLTDHLIITSKMYYSFADEGGIGN